MHVRFIYILMYCYFMELGYIVLGHDFYGFIMNVLGLEYCFFF